MRKQFIGTIAITAVISFTVGAGQYQLQAQQAAQPSAAATPRGAQPSRHSRRNPPRLDRKRAQSPARPARIGGHPNLNGIWQALNSANWNLEAHSVTGLSRFWQLGAIASIPAGKSMIRGGGTIPYTAEALKQRDENRTKWPESDNEAKCYMLGVPRYTYHDIPFQISQGDVDISDDLSVRGRKPIPSYEG